MPTIYRKTEKGYDEIKTRANRLALRLRMALILIDGKATDDDLRKKVPADLDEILQTLLDTNYIEVITILADKPAPPVQAVDNPRETKETAPATAVNFQARRLQALRFLNDQLGPGAESIALRIEKAKTWEECQPLLLLARQSLSLARGESIAMEFARRFIDSP